MLLYIVRHGQTDWNAEGRLQGQQDIALNAIGERQASGNGEKLALLLEGSHLEGAGPFDFVSSPLIRTRQTMERILLALGRPATAYRTDDRLVELSFGDWEGKTVAEVFEIDPDRVSARDADKWHFLPPGPGAESYDLLSKRIEPWLKSVNTPTVCVCHGGVIRCIFRLTGNASVDEAAHMDVPQDKILMLQNGRIEWI